LSASILDATDCPTPRKSDLPTRRDFLRSTTALAAGSFAGPRGNAVSSATLPTIALGAHRITRLVAGGNPLFGYSHFNGILDRHMREYFTDRQVVQFMLDCEREGITAWQSNFPAPLERQFPLIREAGCKLQWLALADPSDIDRSAVTPDTIAVTVRKCAARAAKQKPIAIAIRGVETDLLFNHGRLDVIEDFLAAVHNLGLPAGVSAHNAAAIEAVESKGWPVDYYMSCFYCVSRTQEEFRNQIGVVPVGETYLATDPARMCEVIRKTRKPCLAFKILGAGRRCDSPDVVRRAFEFAFKNIKPTDGVIVGMFPKFSDQIAENSQIVRQLCA
jgi:hypothetical protein